MAKFQLKCTAGQKFTVGFISRKKRKKPLALKDTLQICHLPTCILVSKQQTSFGGLGS